jgi:LuxR family maltose regulon positive regulatory protein
MARSRVAAEPDGPVDLPTAPTVADPPGLDTVLHSKFFIPPPRRQRVDRVRLHDLLRVDPPPPVTLVAAPAGYGKTTLVADWISADARAAAWLTLEASDNDPGTFWTAVATALGTLHPEASRRALALLRQLQPPPPATILAALLNDVLTHLTADAAGRPALLVLDDYHLITQSDIHEGVMTLIERLPPQLRLVITSRSDPPLRLGRLRVRAQLLEIRARDLAFDAPEVEAFLAATMELAVSTEAAHVLLARTEGWAAALQLAALSLRHQPDPATFLARFGGSHHHLLAYLVEEVFSQQPPAVQTFLLATSVLDRMCGNLCDAILAAATPGEGQARLEALEAANLFVVALDDSGQWYRYHPLFGEMLRHRLQQHDPTAARMYRQRASGWYEQAGHGPEAIQQALAAHDWDTTARLIDQAVQDLRRRGEFVLLDAWLAAVPPAEVRIRPGLGFWVAARLVMRGQFIAAEAALEDVEPGAPAAAPTPLAAPALILHGRVAALRSLLARFRHDDPAQIEAQARAALEHLPPDDLDWRALAEGNRGAAAHVADDLDGAEAYYRTASALSEQANYYLLLFSCRTQQGMVFYDRGDFRAAHACCAELRQWAATRGALDVPAAAHIEWLDAHLRYEANDLPGADLAVRRSLLLGDAGRLAEIRGYARITCGRIRLAQNDPAGALAILEEAEMLLIPPSAADGSRSSAMRAAVRAWQATIRLDHPDLGPIGATPDTAAVGPPAPLTHWIWRAAHLLPARLRLHEGDAAGAYADLEARRARAEVVGAQGLLISLLALEAVALDALGRPAAARAALVQALRLGAAEGYCRALLDAGPAIGALVQALGQELSRAPESSPGLLIYLQRLGSGLPTSSAGVAAPPPAPDHLNSPTGAIGEPLSSRELAILRLLAAGCSNQEIADQLIIGVSTVKWYLRTIYEKLDTTSRTQAVARARARGLIR